jgi:hypothetical protein
MLNDRTRVTLFWFTMGMIALVAVVAVITILRACGRTVSMEPAVTISATEISLCPGEQYQFTVEDDVAVTWEATAGTISESGTFIAGDTPGDSTVIATRRGSRQAAEAMVHVVACTPAPTLAPSRTPTATPLPTATPTTEPTIPPPADAQGDVGTYTSGAPVESFPAGVDIRAASVAPDLQVGLQPTAEVPAELVGWAAEGEVLLWITLYEPIPNPPVYTDWLFALDLDGDVATGRPANAARINPDLGDEAVVGVIYDPASGEYAPYFLVWDTAGGSWTDGPDVVRFTLGESRTLVGLALPLETLTQTVAQTTGVTLVPEAVKGRAAVLSFVGEEAAVDFYPDRPD